MEDFYLSGPFSSLDLQVYRESLTRPWGFRLQGGVDRGSPLFIQRVFSGSPAEGVLQRGDVVRKLETLEGDLLQHKTAQDMVRVAGHQLCFQVDRYERKPTWSTACSKLHDHSRDSHSSQSHRSNSMVQQKTPTVTSTNQNLFTFDNFGGRHYSVPNSPRIYSRQERNQNFITQQEVFLHKPQSPHLNFSGGPLNGTPSYYTPPNQQQTAPRVNRILSNPVIAYPSYSSNKTHQNHWSIQSPNFSSNSIWGSMNNGPQEQNTQHFHQYSYSHNLPPQRSRTVSSSMININSHGQPLGGGNQEWTVISNHPGRKRYSQQLSVPIGGNMHPTSQWDHAPLRSSDQFGSTLSLDRGMSIMRSSQSPQTDSLRNINSSNQQTQGVFYNNIPKMHHPTNNISNITTLKSFTNNLPTQPQTYDSLKLIKPNSRSALKQKSGEQMYQLSPNLKTKTPVGFQKSVAFDVRKSPLNFDQNNHGNKDQMTDF